MMKDVKTRFDKGRGKMTAVKKNELVTNLKETTLNIAASNWKSKVNQDCSLNAAWRQEKIAFVEDYIVREATFVPDLKKMYIFLFFCRTGSYT